jgi:hypothetical protein
MSVDAADCVDQFKQEVQLLASEVERLKQQVERLTKVVTPRSSFLTTSNRTMPGWGNSSYTRCQLSFSWTELNKGYKEREITFRTGGLGRHMQEDVYESWVCMDHFCGDPVFCWVYHEIEKIFTPWGTNSELLLITGVEHTRTDTSPVTSGTATNTPAPVPASAPAALAVQSWTEADVESFFTRCNLPVHGLQGNAIDGPSLVLLFLDADAPTFFCQATPDGLGFSNIMFVGRFTKEMSLLGVTRPKK